MDDSHTRRYVAFLDLDEFTTIIIIPLKVQFSAADQETKALFETSVGGVLKLEIRPGDWRMTF